MSADPTIEFFTYELFNHLWLDIGVIKEPLTRKGTNETPVQSKLNADIVKAVTVRMVLFEEFYRRIIMGEYCWFRYSKADFYAFLVRNFPNKDSCYMSVMDKILALCAFVAHTCIYSYTQNNNLFTADSYLFCAMYIDEELRTQFYKEGDWFGLNRICQSYIPLAAFLNECSFPKNREGVDNFSLATMMRIMRGIENFRRFIIDIRLFETCVTAYWVYDYFAVNDQSSLSKEGKRIKSLSPEKLELILFHLKDYCDPFASSMKKFDSAYNSAISINWIPNMFLNIYPETRIENVVSVQKADFYAMKYLILDMEIDTLAPSPLVLQSKNSETGDSEIHAQPPPTLSTIENPNNDWNKLGELLEEKLKKLNKHSELEHNSYSYQVADLSTSGSSLEGSYNFMSFSSAQTSPNEKKANPFTIQTLTAEFSPERIYCPSPGTPKALKEESNSAMVNISNFDTYPFQYNASSNYTPITSSAGKDSTPKTQSERQKLSSARILFPLQSTPTFSTVVTLSKCEIENEIVASDNSNSCNLRSQDRIPKPSMTSNVEKEKVTLKFTENKLKPHIKALPQNLPRIPSDLKECANPFTDEKEFHYLSPTDMEDFDEDLILSASDNVLLKGRVQKMVEVEDHPSRTPKEYSSQTILGTEVSSTAPKSTSKKKKKKKKSEKTKKSEETTHPKTRRKHLEGTEEYALDILRMTLVMGNKTCLKTIKPTLQYFKNKRTVDEKENGKNFWVPSSTPKPSKTKKDKDKAIGMLSNLDVDSLSLDGSAISPDSSRCLDTKKIRSRRKKSSKIQSAQQKLSPARMLFPSQSTPPSCRFLKLGKCRVADQIAFHDKSTWCNLNSLHQLPTSKKEKEKQTPKVTKNKSKSQTKKLSHSLPQSTSALMERLTDEKVDHFSSKGVDDIDQDSVSSSANTVARKKKFHRKMTTIEGCHTKIHTELSSQTQSRTEVPCAQSPSAEKKNKKKLKKKKKEYSSPKASYGN